MKIRDRLALIFTLSAAGVLLVFSLLIYLASAQHGAATQDRLLTWLIVCFIVAIPLMYLIGRLAARQILKPIAGKIRKANRISASNLQLRLNVYNEKDELGQLALTFNNMLDRLEASFELQKNFISNASHEIRNPLTAIIGETEVCLAKRRSTDEYIASLQSIGKEADRLEALVSSLLSLATTGFDESQISLEETRLDEVLFEARAVVNKSYPDSKVSIDFSSLPEDAQKLSLKGNPNLLRIALVNLLENACKFSARQEVQVKVAFSEDTLQLSVIDKGVGIPPQELENIFQPFYRARNARSFKGFGIGLSLSDKIIRLHKGQMQIISEEGKGTCINIRFNTCGT